MICIRISDPLLGCLFLRLATGLVGNCAYNFLFSHRAPKPTNLH